MKWPNEITSLLNISYPIVQAPMLGVTTSAMVSKISNAGGLGSLAVGGMSADKTLELIRQTKSLTKTTFAVNLFTHSIPAVDDYAVTEMKNFLVRLSAKHGIAISIDHFEPFDFHTYEEQVDILISEKIRVVSFTFGIPADVHIENLKRNGIVLIGTATSLKEAVLLEEKEIDMICVQGIEAGGHRGSFIDNEPLPQIGLHTLLSDIKEKTNKPLIAAGGIYDGNSVSEAFNRGAKAVQIGSLFINSNESDAFASYKERVQNASSSNTTLTRAFSGRWARGIRNAFMDEINMSGLTIPPYPFQNTLTTKLRSIAKAQNSSEMTNLWAGEYAYKAEMKPAEEIFKTLIKEVEAL